MAREGIPKWGMFERSKVQGGFAGFVGATSAACPNIPLANMPSKARDATVPIFVPTPRIEPLFAVTSGPRAPQGPVRGSL